MSDMPAPAQQPAAIAEVSRTRVARGAGQSRLGGTPTGAGGVEREVPGGLRRRDAGDAASERGGGSVVDQHPAVGAGVFLLRRGRATFTDASCYPVHPAFDEIPELAGALRAWAHEAQLTIPEFTEVVAVLGRIEAEGEDVAAWPAHIREARDRALQETSSRRPMVGKSLTRAGPCGARVSAVILGWPGCSTKRA